MSEIGSIETRLGGIADMETRRILVSIFTTLLPDTRFGRAVTNTPSTNMGGGFFTATTPAVANTEFSIEHSFGHAPYLLIPVLPLNSINAKIARLTVTRAADADRVWLSSPDTDAAIVVYLEG